MIEHEKLRLQYEEAELIEISTYVSRSGKQIERRNFPLSKKNSKYRLT